MPLPSGILPLAPSEPGSVPPHAFLVRFPEDTWGKLASAARSGQEVTLTVDDGIALNLPGQEPLQLDAHAGQPNELYALVSGSQFLEPIGNASGRLSVPFSAMSRSRAADKVKQQNAELDRERQARAERVAGKPTSSAAVSRQPTRPSTPATMPTVHQPAISMARVMSGPAVMSSATTERIPLKTRVVQLLALGPSSLDRILERTNGDVEDVMRIVNVIAQKNNGSPLMYTLRSAQYAKIKIGSWRYTHEEKVKVIALARKALDDLKLPPDAEEREELDQKEREAFAGSASSSGSNAASPPGPSAAPVSAPPPASPPKPKRVSPVKQTAAVRNESAPSSRRESPAPPAAKSKIDKVERTKVGKQIAKMRSEHSKRSSSLPNSKPSDGIASPRLPPASTGYDSDVSDAKAKPRAKETKAKGEEPEKVEKAPRSDKAGRATKPAKDSASDSSSKRKREEAERGKARLSRDYTSSEDSDSDGGRGRNRATKGSSSKTAAANGKSHTNGNAKQSRAARNGSPSYTSSDDDRDSRSKRARASSPASRLPSFKRKAPAPAPLDLQRSNGRKGDKDKPPDAKALRERYDDLFPRYERLSNKLAALYQAAERVRDGGSPDNLANESDVARKVAQWEEWHGELENIRAWFAA